MIVREQGCSSPAFGANRRQQGDSSAGYMASRLLPLQLCLLTMDCMQLVEQGVDQDRVDLVGLYPDTGSHLASYGGVDIALDPWPYAGTTTTAEAMLMGVPIITHTGASSKQRLYNIVLWWVAQQ